MREQKVQALVAYAEEHYAHARDHEHLRAQVTAILSAGSTVLFGFCLEHLCTSSQTTLLAGVVIVVLSLLNLRLNFLHHNRFKAHAKTARRILIGVEDSGDEGPSGEVSIKQCRETFDEIKRGSLTMTWNLLPSLMTALGIIVTGIELATILGHLECGSA